METVDFTALGRGGTSVPSGWRASRHAGERSVIVVAADACPDGLDLARQRVERLEAPDIVHVHRAGGAIRTFVLVVASGARPGQ